MYSSLFHGISRKICISCSPEGRGAGGRKSKDSLNYSTHSVLPYCSSHCDLRTESSLKLFANYILSLTIELEFVYEGQIEKYIQTETRKRAAKGWTPFKYKL